MKTSSLRSRIGMVAYACLIAWGHMGMLAFASFSSAPSAPAMTIASATIASPTSLTATNGTCTVLTSTNVNLAWTATSSTFADGYEIFRSLTNGGPYVSIGTVADQGTASYVDATPLFSTTYYYVVKAKKNVWRSVTSNQASVTTPSILCVV